MSDDEFRQMLAAVSAEFRNGLPARIAGIDGLWGEILRGKDIVQPVEALIRALHTIAGSAETFGLAAVGEAAAAAEGRLEPFRGARQLPAAAQAEITSLLDALRGAAGAGREFLSRDCGK